MGAGVTTGLMLGSGVSGAVSDYSAGEANGAIADFNAKINRMQEKDALSRGESSVMELQKRTAGLEGTQRAGFAGQGVVVDQGSAADVARSTEAMSEADKVTIRNNAALEAWGFRVQAIDNRFKGRLSRVEGRTKAFGTLLTTGADVSRYSYTPSSTGFGGGVSAGGGFGGNMGRSY